MPQYWRNKTLLFKTEVTYGTDSVPTGAANAILATDFTLSPMEGQDTSRELELPFMGAQGTVPTGVHAKIAFKVELKASGTAGTPPVIGPLLRACAFAEVIVAATSVTYNRVSSGFGSATIYFNVDGTLYTLNGARGTGVLRVNKQGIVYIEFEFWGQFVQPVAQTVPTLTLGTQLSQFPLVANRVNTPVFTIGGTTHVLHTLSLNFGNTVEPRMPIGPEEIVIPMIAESLETQIDAVPLATLNPFALASTGATSAIILQHGVAAGQRCTLNVPRAQARRPGNPVNSQGVVEWPLGWVPLPMNGNDQLTLAFT